MKYTHYNGAEIYTDNTFYQPAAREAWPAGPKITLRFPRLFVYIYIYIYLCVRTYHVHNNYVMNIVVAMQPFIDFGNLDGCFV